MMNQHEFAKLVGVSTYSVSVAFGREGRISETKRQMILDKAKEHGYRPNKLAASLRATKTNSIGVLWNFTARWTGDVGIALDFMDRVHQKGYTTYQEQRRSKADVVCDQIREMMSRSVDAIVLDTIPSVLEDEQLNELTKNGPPLIAVCREDVPGFAGDLIVHDRNRAIRQVAAHFAKTGRKRPAISCSIVQESNPPKVEAFRDECAKYGIVHDKILVDQVVYPGRVEEIGARALNGFRESFPGAIDIDAFFCLNDTGALFVMSEILDRGLRVPEDVAVVGFTNVEYGQVSRPPLATVDRRHAELAECMEKALLGRLESPGMAPIRETVHMEFIPRKSAGGIG